MDLRHTNFFHLLPENFGAEEGTRTPTAVKPPAPKAGASANSATSAHPHTSIAAAMRATRVAPELLSLELISNST